MSMTITLSDRLEQVLTNHLAAFRKADAEFLNAVEVHDWEAQEDAYQARSWAACRLATVLDCVIEEGPKQ